MLNHDGASAPLHLLHPIRDDLSVIELNELQYLHAHVRLVHNSPRKGKMQEVPVIGVDGREEYIRDVEKVMPVLTEKLLIPPSIEHLY